MYDNRELAKNEAFKSGTLTVTENSIIADITLFNGETHHIEYHGDCIMEDYTEPTFADIHPVSQYTSDIEFDVTGGEFMPIYRGNWYDSQSDVWFVHMIEQRNGFSGVYLLFDFLVPRSNGGFENNSRWYPCAKGRLDIANGVTWVVVLSASFIFFLYVH